MHRRAGHERPAAVVGLGHEDQRPVQVERAPREVDGPVQRIHRHRRAMVAQEAERQQRRRLGPADAAVGRTRDDDLAVVRVVEHRIRDVERAVLVDRRRRLVEEGGGELAGDVGGRRVELDGVIVVEAVAPFAIVPVGVADMEHAAVEHAAVGLADEAQDEEVHLPVRPRHQGRVGGLGVRADRRRVITERLERRGERRRRAVERTAGHGAADVRHAAIAGAIHARPRADRDGGARGRARRRRSERQPGEQACQEALLLDEVVLRKIDEAIVVRRREDVIRVARRRGDHRLVLPLQQQIGFQQRGRVRRIRHDSRGGVRVGPGLRRGRGGAMRRLRGHDRMEGCGRNGNSDRERETTPHLRLLG